MGTSVRPRVFLDVSTGTSPAGRLVIELFVDKAPKACENFRALCLGLQPNSTYKLNKFHRVIDDFMIQGGDITNGDGTGGKSIWGEDFEEEDVSWRDVDKEGLLCMVTRGKNLCNSQFFITLVPCDHLNGKHTVFGHIVSGMDALGRIAKVEVDDHDQPLEPVTITHCGELERRKKSAIGSSRNNQSSHVGDRERVNQNSHSNQSTSHSRSSSRKGRKSRDTHSSQEREIPRVSTKKRQRRRSDHSLDENLRGRVRRRSRGPSRSPSPIVEEDASSPKQRHREPSRSPRLRSMSPAFRRRQSLPNHYERWKKYEKHENAESMRGEEMDEDNSARYDTKFRESKSSRTGGHLSENKPENEIVYKGRGSMKFRENQQRW